MIAMYRCEKCETIHPFMVHAAPDVLVGGVTTHVMASHAPGRRCRHQVFHLVEVLPDE